jgi:hypothetical protein
MERPLASSSGGATLKLWDAAAGEMLVSMQGHSGEQHCLESGWWIALNRRRYPQ